MENERPPMEFEEKADVWEIRLAGRFNPAVSTQLYEELIAIVESPKDVLVDWSRAERLDMTALQVLVAFEREVRRLGRRFLVSPAPEGVKQWLRLAGLEGAFLGEGPRIPAGAVEAASC